jgi:hypothetical protein
MVKHRRQRFFASAARGKRGKWTHEDWNYTFVIVGFFLLVIWLANSYKPGQFVEEYAPPLEEYEEIIEEGFE